MHKKQCTYMYTEINKIHVQQNIKDTTNKSIYILQVIILYLIKVSRDHIPSQYGPCYGSNQGDI